MNKPLSSCPDASTLGEFLTDGLTDSQAGLIARHMETCGSCNALLAELSLGEQFAEEIADLFPNGPPHGPIPDRRPPSIQGLDIGEVLFELLTGQQLDPSNDRNNDRALDGCDRDPELVDLARTCLATEPLDRPTDEAHVARAISNYLLSTERRVHHAELAAAAAIARAEQEAKIRRTFVASGLVVLIALLIAFVALL